MDAPAPVALPLAPTPLVGREALVADACARLGDPAVRLLTLTGPGGVGKTRLALALAEQVGRGFADGAAFVDLSPITDPELVASAVATVLAVRETPRQSLTGALATSLRDRELLLVLDNFEQVVGAAPLVADLLATAPCLRVLATSRVALHIGGEHTYAVPPLATPDPDRLPPPAELAASPAVALFLERARAVRAGFALTEENAAAVARVCARLDGLPLALELAAARVRALSVEQLAGRLDDRFRLLTGGDRTAPSRQQTLRATLDWSHDLLTEPERALLRRLAVFAGGWTLEAAEAVCAGEGLVEADVLDRLTSLVDTSLVVMEERGGEARYRMLETIRAYALERLDTSGEADAARRGHATYFLDLVEMAELLGPGLSVWMDRLTRELANLRAALTWCSAADGAAEMELRIVGALGMFWHLSGHLREGRARIDSALRRAGPRADPRARATALFFAGLLAREESDSAAARDLLEQSRALWNDLDEPRWLARTTMVLGLALRDDGDADAARSLFHQSIERFRAAADDLDLARGLTYLGDFELSLGRYDEARAHQREGLAIAQRMGDRGFIAYSYRSIGYVALATREYGEARRSFAESLKLNHEVNDLRAVAASLAALGRLLLAQGRIEPAVRLLGATEGLLEARGIESLQVDDQRGLTEALRAARRALPADIFAAACAAGRALALDEAAVLALATSNGTVDDPVATPPTRPSTVQDERGLSARELDVLRLLAAGKSNPEIADALVISVNTVERHVTHILQKTGASNRTEAAAFAHRHGLAD